VSWGRPHACRCAQAYACMPAGMLGRTNAHIHAYALTLLMSHGWMHAHASAGMRTCANRRTHLLKNPGCWARGRTQTHTPLPCCPLPCAQLGPCAAGRVARPRVVRAAGRGPAGTRGGVQRQPPGGVPVGAGPHGLPTAAPVLAAHRGCPVQVGMRVCIDQLRACKYACAEMHACMCACACACAC